MDHVQKFAAQVRRHQILLLLLSNGFIIGGWWYGAAVVQIDNQTLLWLLVATATLVSVILGALSSVSFTKPLKYAWQAVMHVAPQTANSPAPNIAHAHLGRELLTSLITHVYQIAHVAQDIEAAANKQRHSLSREFIANSLPLPLLVLNKEQAIVFVNSAATTYLGRDASELIGQNAFTVLDLAFSSDDTLRTWLAKAKTKPVDAHMWSRVRIHGQSNAKKTKQFDLSGYYNKGNPDGFEVILTFLDRTHQYDQDDQGLSFVALAVHELRTPITLLRGYIEALEEELQGKLDDQTTDFVRKLKASSQQLTVFINNILNVARIEGDQLTLRLQEENWPRVVQAAVTDVELRAKTRNLQIVTELDNNLPPVGIDTVSMYEVLNNLLDNAIKYSRPNGKIVVKTALTNDGMVQTTVQDQGMGMPANIVSNLFEKFYRSYHSKTKIGGTGLGLYLCKTIVEAHGGNIWVQSKEGEGSTFGFTLQPYSQVDEAHKNSDNEGIVRRAHGWIKNHSLYRG